MTLTFQLWRLYLIRLPSDGTGIPWMFLQMSRCATEKKSEFLRTTSRTVVMLYVRVRVVRTCTCIRTLVEMDQMRDERRILFRSSTGSLLHGSSQTWYSIFADKTNTMTNDKMTVDKLA
jgi:hypothetical protein